MTNQHHWRSFQVNPEIKKAGICPPQSEKLTTRRQALFQITKVLWHLDIFRRSFRKLSSHACSRKSCVFCALKDLFSQLQFSQEIAMPSDTLRRTLAEGFLDQQRFQLGFMDEAAECFENILLRIHLHVARNELEDVCNARHCVPHQKFAMTLVEQSVCAVCGITSNPLPFTQMVYYVSASALTSQACQTLRPTSQSNSDSFGHLLRRAGGMENIRDCPNPCGAKIQIHRTLINHPEVFSVGVIWNNKNPSFDQIMDVFSTVGTSLRLCDVFHNVVDTRWATLTTHDLVGMITFYEKHYSTFFFHSKLKVWINFDDVTVKAIGPSWNNVVDKCQQGRYQPVLLLYATPCDIPVHTENKPNAMISFFESCMVESSSKKYMSMVENNSIKRSITPSPEKPSVQSTPRRAITPDSDNQFHALHIQQKTLGDYQNLQDFECNELENKEINDVSSESTYISRKTVESIVHHQKKSIELAHNLRTGSMPQDVIRIPEHLNVPRWRDSGNWSGDRNSASSSSSTTMDNSYLFIVNKIQKDAGLSKSPINKSGELYSNSSGQHDGGYDSYSLSSTDSLPLQQGLKHNLELAQIPENYQQVLTDDCKKLWKEMDALMEIAQVAELAGNLERAVILCTAAGSKAREAMNIPYSNSNTIDLAQKKHNYCVMRISYLQKKIKQEQLISYNGKEEKIENRYSRETSKSCQHLRQSSRDKENYSRQNSRELLVNTSGTVNKLTNKSIEIYATLPKKKALKSKVRSANVIEDEEYLFKDYSTQRPTHSQERNKNVAKELLTSPSKSISKLLKSEKSKDIVETISSKSLSSSSVSVGDQKQGRKQHKIRRKLIMGGLIKLKNRSMPDLREGQDEKNNLNSEGSSKILSKESVDDISIGLKGKNALALMSGNLSEGHLEFEGSNSGSNESSGNFNSEKSRMMSKSFHSSSGKKLHLAKVPPPPPLRTTSQLSKSKAVIKVHGSKQKAEQFPSPLIIKETILDQSQAQVNGLCSYTNANHSMQTDHLAINCLKYSTEECSLPFVSSYDIYQNDSSLQMLKKRYESKTQAQGENLYASGILYNPTLVVTQADVHNEQCINKQTTRNEALLSYPENQSVSHLRQPSEEFPPPPYPIVQSVTHSRQASEDFPPPPPLVKDNNHIQIHNTANFQQLSLQQSNKNQTQNKFEQQQFTNLLTQLKLSRKQLKASEILEKQKNNSCVKEKKIVHNEAWLRGLQAEQAQRNIDKQIVQKKEVPIETNFMQQTPVNLNLKPADFKIKTVINSDTDQDVVDYPQASATTVKEIAAQFERKNDEKLLEYVFPSSLVTIVQDHLNSKESEHLGLLTNKVPVISKYKKECIDNSVDSSIQLKESQGTFTTSQSTYHNGSNSTILSTSITLPHDNGLPIDCPDNDISEMALQNTIQNTIILPSKEDTILQKKSVSKKKSVSFCDQVVLVATEDDEKDSYIPNPILERVLRSAKNKPETTQVLHEIRNLKEAKLNCETTASLKLQQHTLPLKCDDNSIPVTLFQEKLGSISSIPINTDLTNTNKHPIKSLFHDNKRIDYSRNTEKKEIVKETYSNVLQFAQIPLTRSSPFQQQIRNSQNNHPLPQQQSQILIQSQSSYPQIHMLHPKHQNIQLSHMQKRENLYPVLMNCQYLSNSLEQKTKSQKNTNSDHQFKKQNNQMNKQPLGQQQQNLSNLRLQNLSATITAIQKPQHNIMNIDKKFQSQSSSLCTMQQQLQQQYSDISNGLCTSSIPESYPKTSQLFNKSYQTLPHQRLNRTLPQNQHPFNKVVNCQQKLSQQMQQQQLQHQQYPDDSLAIGYQQWLEFENIQKISQKMVQQTDLLFQDQNYVNNQILLHPKCTAHHPLQPAKKIKSVQPIEPKIYLASINSTDFLMVNEDTSTKSPAQRVISCNLCRKKQVCEPAIYCTDCDFYMSRFHPTH